MRTIKVLLIAFIIWLVPTVGYAGELHMDGHVGVPNRVTIFTPVPPVDDDNVTCDKDVSFNLETKYIMKNYLYYMVYDITVNEPTECTFTITQPALPDISIIHLSITDHEYENREVEATCANEGYIEFYCKHDDCNDSYKENIQSPLCHSPVKIKAIPANIKESGLTEGECCEICGEILVSQENIPRISTVRLKTEKYYYDGYRKKPQFDIKDTSGNLLKPGVDYIVQYTDTKGKNVNTSTVGSYIAVAKFQGKYSGKVSKKFHICPKKTYIKKLTKGRKCVTVKWSKITSQITGYNIRYSTSSKMLNAKNISIKSKNITSKKIKALKANKKYYVQIRTYKTVDGVKYYSAWSKSKCITTK